ncbi:MAG: chorismate synthase [Bacteroidetes bacterium GWA2_31_9b]|nr:MAG: chorismate synthase [Bacteroidetes bacterium GWA2_31_9b]
MNTFGRIFRIHIYGESHGKEIGVIIDGCPAGIPISTDDFTEDIQRRKGGSKGTTPRIEEDKPIIKSGVFNGKTTGFPILIAFENTNSRSEDYNDFLVSPRPSHADFTAKMKFAGYNDHRGGGHFSGRLTLGLIAAGVIAKKIINPVKINATVIEVGGSKNIDSAIDNALKNNDSIGGIVECRAEKVMVGFGEPFFDTFESLISHIVFAIPGIKGIEFGSGFSSAQMTGSEHNDIILEQSGKTKTNFSGGINGGITNGNKIYFKVAVKPTSSISKPQQTLNMETGKLGILEIKGRHDTCIALRVPVILEAVTAIVLADLMMLEQKITRII